MHRVCRAEMGLPQFGPSFEPVLDLLPSFRFWPCPCAGGGAPESSIPAKGVNNRGAGGGTRLHSEERQKID